MDYFFLNNLRKRPDTNAVKDKYALQYLRLYKKVIYEIMSTSYKYSDSTKFSIF